MMVRLASRRDFMAIATTVGLAAANRAETQTVVPAQLGPVPCTLLPQQNS